MCLIIAATLLSSWATLTLLKASRTPTKLAVPAPGANPDTTGASWITALVTGLEVNLNNPGPPAETAPHVLFIPTLSVRVGPKDAELAIRHLNNTSDLIRQKLEERLAAASYDELLKPEGEQYLSALILAAVAGATGTGDVPDPVPEAAPPSDRYGVVEVALPRSYSVG